ncbi:MAG TPA: hypothetical protein VJU54_11445, partial [Nitrospiraceae bacterium]|nr:hypothetical protein [Nitrospiraceae bacterium]
GLAHGLVTQEQYSFLVAAVIASAVVPTLIAGLFFVPAHLLPKTDHAEKTVGGSMIWVTRARERDEAAATRICDR